MHHANRICSTRRRRRRSTRTSTRATRSTLTPARARSTTRPAPTSPRTRRRPPNLLLPRLTNHHIDPLTQTLAHLLPRLALAHGTLRTTQIRAPHRIQIAPLAARIQVPEGVVVDRHVVADHACCAAAGGWE